VLPLIRSVFLLTLLLASQSGWAQASRTVSPPSALVRQFPADRFGMLRLASETRSPAAVHQTYHPLVGGRWLWPGTVRVALAGERVLNVFADRLVALDSVRGLTHQLPDAGAGATMARAYVRSRLRPTEQSQAVVQSVEAIWYEADSVRHRVRAGWVVKWGHPDTRIGAWETLLDDATGQAVRPAQDLLCYHQHNARRPPRDTTARAFVFRPDPLTTAQQPYGRPYIDSLDTDRPALNQQRVLDTLRLTFAADSFRLRNPWFTVAEFDPPVRPVAAALTASGLQFTRAEAGFQQVNALFHLTQARQYLGDLGFGGLHPQAIRLDASGLSGADQSRFSPIDTTLSFGEGGVDDAEDADVVVHEYLHALAFAAAPNTNVGMERRTLDEANADYWAAVHSAQLGGPAAYGREQVFNWDGHNEFWAGRWVISPKRYPNDLQHNPYLDADVWSATLWQIRAAVPPVVADRIWLQHLYSYAPNLTMPEAAVLLLQADTLLYGAAHADTIFYFFERRHILGAPVVGTAPEVHSAMALVFATDAFAHGETARFQSPQTAQLELMSVTGASVWRGAAPANQTVPIPGAGLRPGLYVLRWQTASGTGQARLLRQ
jgi:hypothetical protein